MKIQLIALFAISLSFVSCEKTVTFNLDEVSPKLVVEGTIENEQLPVIYLSRSLNYFSQIGPDILANSFVRNAEVFVSNGTLTHKLKEYAVPIGGGYNAYYYSIDSSDLATAFTGQLNTNYSLRIIWEGKEYTATTRIPGITRQIDSFFWKPAPAGNPPEKVSVMLKATDPAGLVV